MYAVIKTGGKQYRVAPNDVITIERFGAEAGASVEFSEVLMVADDSGISLGQPLVTGASVAGQITALTRGPKLVIFKKRRRKHFRRKNGHRQDLATVLITEILTNGRKASKVTEGEKEATTVAEGSVSASPLSSESGGPDDLSLISGVGPKIKKTLNELGFVTFAQIAALTPADIDNIETALKSKGRVARDDWIAQARELEAGGLPRAKIDRAKPAKPE